MKTLATGLLALLLIGCAGQQAGSDPFDQRAEFAARRQLETTVVRDMDLSTASVHVIEVLMDLDCILTEINSRLGVISARRGSRLVEAGSLLMALRRPPACAGSDVTVSLLADEDGSVQVRAAFDPPSPAASESFRIMLRRSVAQQEQRAAQRSRP